MNILRKRAQEVQATKVFKPIMKTRKVTDKR